MPRIVIQERARGLEKGGRAGTKGKHNPFITMPWASPGLSCLWVRWRKLRLWSAGKLFEDPELKKELSPQPQTTTLVCSTLKPGAGGMIEGPLRFLPLGALSLLGNAPLLSVVFSPFPFGSRGNNNNNDDLLWVWEYPRSGGARVSSE